MKKLLVLMLVLALAGIASAEIFVNGDFEAGAWSGGGSGSGGGPGGWGWQAFPPIYQTSGGSDGGAWMQLDQSAAPYTGTWNWAWSGVWNSLPNATATDGQSFTVSGMAKHLAGDTTLRGFISFENAGGLRVDYNGDGISMVLGNGNNNQYNLDRYMPTWTAGGSWGAFSDTFVVPSALGIASFGVTFSVEAAPGAVGIDQVSLVPEPISIALLGLGGLFIRRRK